MKSFNSFFTCILIALCVLFFIFTVLAAQPTPEILCYEEYRIKSGDTLWTVARQSNGYDSLDTRKIIDDIEAESDCSADIYPGQTIYIPVYDI